jgi:hypothetical protein
MRNSPNRYSAPCGDRAANHRPAEQARTVVSLEFTRTRSIVGGSTRG